LDANYLLWLDGNGDFEKVDLVVNCPVNVLKMYRRRGMGVLRRDEGVRNL